MLDIKFLREHADVVRDDLRKRKDEDKLAWVDRALAKDEEWRKLKGEADTAPADGNVTVQEIVLFSEEKVPSLTEEHASHKQYPLTFSRGFDFTVNGPRN